MAREAREECNIADVFLDRRIRENMGDRTALRTDRESFTYEEVRALSNRFGNLFREAGVRPEQRIILAIPDGPDFVAGLFGALKIGAVVVMVNPRLDAEAISGFYDYTRAVAAVVHPETAGPFREAAEGARHLERIIQVGDAAFAADLTSVPDDLQVFESHPDDPAIWLFSGGTTGRPKAVVQTHASFANTTERYGKGVIRYTPDDVTLSVPKLYFGYATGSNLFFPFSVGASSVLFPERCTAEVLFEKIARHRPTILINVPTMINHMVNHPGAARQDLSCLRLATSAGEALPAELHQRWRETFGVELLDGLGTAEMWHIFLTNQPGRVRPGTLGTVVPGFEVRVCDEDGREVPDGEVGRLWVRGGSLGKGYWQRPEQTKKAFRGEWYASGDMIRRDADGYVTYCGRADDLLKVGGKWLSPQEVENCLLQHERVKEVAVVGVTDESGLTKPYAFVVVEGVGEGAAAVGAGPELEEALQAFVRDRLEPYKYPRRVLFLDSFPRTHLGKVDRGALRRRAGGAKPSA
jgi:benzoate-CoA ligase family protein